MAVNLSPVFGVAGQLFDNNGNPLAGGKIYTYLAGTTTPAATYTNASGSIAHSNPIVLDGAGRVPSGEIWLTDGITYKFVVEDSTNALIGTYDNLTGINSNFVAYTAQQEIQTATAGQTVFNLTTMQYQPGTNSLSVFVDGVNQYGPGAQYAFIETDQDTVTFVSGLHVGASVKFTTAQLNNAGATDSSLVTYDPPFAGSVVTNVEAKLSESLSIADFGASPSATAAANTTAIQAAINACPNGGSVLIPSGVFQINDAIIINKAITIQGEGPGKWIDSLGGSIIKQTNATKNAFTFRATVNGYAFGQYGLNDVNLQDFVIEGPSGYPNASNYAARGIGCDTSVNGGDYHIRECTFTNLQVRFFNTGIELVGICYLNDFYGGVISFCGTGFALYKGAAPDRGGQTRFFGTSIGLITDACLRWNTDTDSGDLSLFGCTLSDAQYGLISNEQATLMVSGCSFENLKKTGNLGAGVYIEIKEANPASDASKVFVGNKFLLSDVDIWIDCTNVSTTSGNFAWPMLIDGNTLLSPEALRITMPVGANPMSSSQFVLGAANSGSNNGQLATSQVSANYAGLNVIQRPISRRTTFGPSAAGKLTLPAGMVVTSARMYLTANSTSFTALFGGDAADNNRYYSGINGQTAPLNTWTNWTAPVPQFIVDTTSKQYVVLSGTGGLLGAVGVFEIQGYIP